MHEEQLQKQLEEYKKLAQDDKNVDVGKLMMAAIQSSKENVISPRQKRWAYLISIALPPFGLIFAFKFFFSGRDDGQKAAIICIILTVVSFILAWITLKLMLAGSGVQLEQIEQINPQDLKDLYQ